MSTEPKLSEVFAAASFGALAPYHQSSIAFSSADYAHAKSMARIFEAIAKVYEARGL